MKLPIGLGMSSLITMFIVLTMAALTSLTLATSYRESVLTQRQIETTKTHYLKEAQKNQYKAQTGEEMPIS